MSDLAHDPVFDDWPDGDEPAAEPPPPRPGNRHRGGASDEPLSDLERAVGHRFADRGLLRQALVHSSAAPLRSESNERLEFLGDAVFGAVVCESLFTRLPACDEGELTRIKSAVVSRKACAEMTKRLGLDHFIVLGRGVASKAGRVPASILAAAYEAVVAAVYLDGGLGAAAAFVRRTTEPHVEASLSAPASENYKSTLQQRTQRHGGEAPEYRVLGERGPDHSKAFRVQALVEGTAYEPAWGPNKKVAEQRAAGNAIAQIAGDEPPYAGE